MYTDDQDEHNDGAGVPERGEAASEALSEDRQDQELKAYAVAIHDLWSLYSDRIAGLINSPYPSVSRATDWDLSVDLVQDELGTLVQQDRLPDPPTGFEQLDQQMINAFQALYDVTNNLHPIDLDGARVAFINAQARFQETWQSSPFGSMPGPVTAMLLPTPSPYALPSTPIPASVPTPPTTYQLTGPLMYCSGISQPTSIGYGGYECSSTKRGMTVYVCEQPPGSSGSVTCVEGIWIGARSIILWCTRARSVTTLAYNDYICQ
jgi:hypothetical protein